MNSKILAAFLCLLSLSGCIITDNSSCDSCNVGDPGDVTFLWTFQGGRCSDVPYVKSVNIRIPGETLLNGGVYDCNTQGVDGITLHNFDSGTYNYTLEAVDYDNVIVYTATGSFTIDGNVRKVVDLMPEGSSGSSYAYLSWFFPNGATCYQAGVASVGVTIDGDASLSKTFDCSAGTGTNSVSTPNLSAGAHTIEITSFDSSGHRLYYYSGNLTTQANRPVAVSYNLWAVGGLSVSWTLSRDGGATNISCQDAGVSSLSINFKDANGNWVLGNGVSGPCGQPPANFDKLAPGRYLVSIFGKDNANYTYRSADNLYVDVVAFQQRTLTVGLQRGP